MNSRRLGRLAAVLLLALAACDRPAPAGPLAGSHIGGAFALTDQHGRAFGSRDLRGRYALVYFGYTFCPDVCPTDVATLSRGLSTFEAARPALGARVTPVFVTVDPARDTPPVLAAFAANFHPRLVALTGSEGAVEAAKRAYRVTARRVGPPGAADYLVDHSALTYLVGPDGAAIAYTAPGSTPADVTRELETYVR